MLTRMAAGIVIFLCLPVSAQEASHDDPSGDVSLIAQGQDYGPTPADAAFPVDLADLIEVSLFQPTVDQLVVNFTVMGLERLSEVETDPGSQLAYVLNFTSSPGAPCRIALFYGPDSVGIGTHRWLASGRDVSRPDTSTPFEYAVHAEEGKVQVFVPIAWLMQTLNTTELGQYEPWSRLSYSLSANWYFADTMLEIGAPTFSLRSNETGPTSITSSESTSNSTTSEPHPNTKGPGKQSPLTWPLVFLFVCLAAFLRRRM